MMNSLLIRNVSPDTLRRLKEDAERRGVTQQELLTALLSERYGDPPLVVAWIKATRNGELSLSGGSDDEPALCAECGQDLDWPWIGVLSDGSLHMPVCTGCATSQ